MGRGEIKKESKGRPSSKGPAKEKPMAQVAYTAPEVISKKKDKDRW